MSSVEDEVNHGQVGGGLMSTPLTSRCFILGLIFVVVLLHCMALPHRELRGEEGRRVVAAREMIANSDAIVPTVWGQPYLNKPPLYPWLTIAVSRISGAPVNEIAVRIPALVATVMTGLLLLLAGHRLGNWRQGSFAALFFLLCPVVIQKSTLGETDLLLTLGCTMYAIEMLLIQSATSKRGFTTSVWMTAGLCIALLAKGPIALLFMLSVMVAAAIAGGSARWKQPSWWGPPLAALAISCIWVLVVLGRLEDQGLMTNWMEELSRSRSGGEWWRHRWEYISGVGLGFFPAILFVFFSGSPRIDLGWLGDARFRPLATAIVIPGLVLLLWPGVQPRYLLPALPLLAWMAAMFIDDSMAGGHAESGGEKAISVFTRIIRTLVGSAGVASFIIAIALLFTAIPIEGLPLISAAGFMMMGVMLSTAVWVPLKKSERGSAESSAMRWILMLLAWLGCHALIIEPDRGLYRPLQEVARQIEQMVPSDEILWHDVNARWNTLGQIDRELRIVTSEAGPGAGDWFLTVEAAESRLTDGWKSIEFDDGLRASLGLQRSD
jgi:4-amino-4-deoxy-L-arabinose transferase-like glycosyltransferase